MELTRPMFNPVLVPIINFISSILSYGLKRIRESYIRNNFQQNGRLNNILQEINAKAISRGINIKQNIRLCLITKPNQSFIAKLFEDFKKQKTIYCHFNTIVIDSEYEKQASYDELEKAIMPCIVQLSINKPLVDYILDKSLQLILLTTVILAKQLLLITTPVLIGLTIGYVIGFLINLGICKFVDFMQTQKINSLVDNLIGLPLKQTSPAPTIVNNSKHGDVVPAIISVPLRISTFTTRIDESEFSADQDRIRSFKVNI